MNLLEMSKQDETRYSLKKSKRANIHILVAQMKKYSPPNYITMKRHLHSIMKKGVFLQEML